MAPHEQQPQEGGGAGGRRGEGQQQPEQPPPLEVEDIVEMLMARLLAGGRKRPLDAGDWSSPSSPSSPAAGTPRRGGGSPPRRRSAGGRLQHNSEVDHGGEEEDEEDDDAVAESFWESPVVVSIVQELLAWPLGVAYSAVVLVVCTWAHLSNLALYRLSKLLRRLGHLWRRLRLYLARTSSSSSSSSSSHRLPSLKLPDRLARNASIQVIKSGLYWCGPNNTMVKDASVGAAFGGDSPGAGADCAFFVPGRPSVIYVHGYQPRWVIGWSGCTSTKQGSTSIWMFGV